MQRVWWLCACCIAIVVLWAWLSYDATRTEFPALLAPADSLIAVTPPAPHHVTAVALILLLLLLVLRAALRHNVELPVAIGAEAEAAAPGVEMGELAAADEPAQPLGCPPPVPAAPPVPVPVPAPASTSAPNEPCASPGPQPSPWIGWLPWRTPVAPGSASEVREGALDATVGAGVQSPWSSWLSWRVAPTSTLAPATAAPLDMRLGVESLVVSYRDSIVVTVEVLRGSSSAGDTVALVRSGETALCCCKPAPTIPGQRIVFPCSGRLTNYGKLLDDRRVCL